MAIRPPAWCANAVPTASGWEDPDTGELYVSARFTGKEISEYWNPSAEVLTEVPKPKNDFVKTPQVLTEAPIGNKALEDMNKLELEAVCRQYGVELDRRSAKSKKTLLEKTRDILSRN